MVEFGLFRFDEWLVVRPLDTLVSRTQSDWYTAVYRGISVEFGFQKRGIGRHVSSARQHPGFGYRLQMLLDGRFRRVGTDEDGCSCVERLASTVHR